MVCFGKAAVVTYYLLLVTIEFSLVIVRCDVEELRLRAYTTNEE